MSADRRTNALIRQLQGGAWHTVGATGEPAFENAWVPFDARTTRFIRLGRVVHIVGVVKSGTVGATIFTLPDGFRPDSEVLSRIFPIVSNAAFGYVDVFSDGRVVLAAGSNVWAALDSISFLAAP